MVTRQTTRHANRLLILALLLIVSYQLLLVADRWVAAFKYINKFGAASRPWVSLGFDTVVVGFASLLLVLTVGMWVRRKVKAYNDTFAQIASILVIGFAVLAAGALLVLVLAPATALR